MRGSFIVLEGPDGSGTSSHAELLSDALSQTGHTVCHTHEPTTGIIGTFIREALTTTSIQHDALQLLFCADRAQHIADEIEPRLMKGDSVISDRYALSTRMYGAALGLDPEWLELVNKNFIQPTHTILLLPPFETCMQRLNRREQRDRMEESTLQRRVYDQYAALQEDEHLSIIDSSGDRAQVAERILRIAQQVLIDHD